MNFLTPLAFMGGLIAIPIILMYMLRLRRREVVVSSTYLWQQVLQDHEANTPWQRLRRNLLLILQLMILALLVLALARPFVTVPAVSAGQVTVLLDASASMNAVDVNGGSRFEEAKRQALDIVNTLSVGDRMTVIRVAEVPEVLASGTSDRLRLRDAIRSAQPSFAQSDWDAALNLAAGGGVGAEDFTIVIISDGGLPESAGLPGVNAEVRYIPVGEAGDNVAITALATRALPGETPQLYAQITNYGAAEARVVFTLLVDGERFAASNEVIPPGGTQSIVSSALPQGFTTLEARLTQSVNAVAPDYLAVDDVAYAVASESTIRRVLLVTTGNLYLEQVLRSLPGLDVVRTDGAAGIPEDYDVYLFDGIVPSVLPAGDLFFVNPSQSTSLFVLGAENTETLNPSVDANDLRMAFVDVAQLHLMRFRDVSGVDWARPLITVDGGPILLAGETGGRQVALMPFNLRESDLPLQIAWPVLMANLMEWFTPRSVLAVTDSISVGESLVIRPSFEATSVRIRHVGDETTTLPVEHETVVFAGTREPGIYTLELLSGSTVIGQQVFAVNLFSGLESRIAPVARDDLQIEGTTIVTDAAEELGQREYWPLVALLALAVLMIEWYAYHRRLRIPTVFRPLRRQVQGT